MTTFFGAKGSSQTTSNLYTIDSSSPATPSSIGAIGFGITGLAIDPITGILYGVTNHNSAVNPDSLVSINKTTGAGTFIGALGTRISDIAIDSAGNIYGFSGTTAGGLFSINKSTGAATAVGGGYIVTGGGCAFDASDVLYLSDNGTQPGRNLNTVDLITGVRTVVNSFTGSPNSGGGALNAACFVSSTLYGIDQGFGTGTYHLVSIDPSTAVITDLGTLPDFFDALVGSSAASILLTPAFGEVGDTIGVSGSGLAPSAVVSATFDGSPLSLSGTTTTDGSGNLSGVTFIVPAVAVGSHSIVFSDGTNSIPLSFTVNPVTVDIDASDYNTLSGTVTNLGGGCVKETQNNPNVFASDGRGTEDTVYTFKASGSQLPPNGRYEVILNATFNRSSAIDSQWNIAIKRNGEFLWPVASLRWPGTAAVPSAKTTWNIYDRGTDHTSPAPTWQDGPGPSTIPIVSGDVIEIIAYNNSHTDTSTWLEICGITLVQVEAGGGNGTAFDLASMPRTALGPNADFRHNPAHEPQLLHKDFCILDNGDIYVAYIGFNNFSPAYNNLKLVKWNGSAWSTVSTDLSRNAYGADFVPLTGRPRPYSYVSVDTDGTDVYIAWGEVDYSSSKSVTFFGGGSTTVYENKWHVVKYVPGTGFTELGTGQNAIPIASRTHATSSVGLQANDAASEETSIKLKISPGGVPWVATAETTDNWIATAETEMKPYVYYWDGSSWIDTILPDPLQWDTSHGFILNAIDVNSQPQIDLTFCHHDGPNEHPSVIYSIELTDTIRGSVDRFDYAEYDGSSWGNRLTFTGYEAWPGATLSEEFFPSFTQGHLQQGMSLDNDGTQVIFAAALWNSMMSGGDWIKVAKLKADGTAFESYLPELSGPDLLTRNDKTSGGRRGGWFDPTGCQMSIDENGIPWIIYTADETNYGNVEGIALARPPEPGTANYWILGSRNNAVLYNETTPGISKIRCKNGFVYILGQWEISGVANSPIGGVFKAPIDDPYTPWSTGISRLIHYFKDGSWHAVNSEATRDLHYFKDGAWHKVNTEATRTVKAVRSATWVT